MSLPQSSQRIALTEVQDVLLASLQVDPLPQVLAQLRDDLLATASARGVRAVIFELSGLPVMDAVVYGQLTTTTTMLAWMGVRSVFAGLRPGMVAALAVLDVDVSAVPCAADVDGALAMLSAGPLRGVPR